MPSMGSYFLCKWGLLTRKDEPKVRSACTRRPCGTTRRLGRRRWISACEARSTLIRTCEDHHAAGCLRWRWVFQPPPLCRASLEGSRAKLLRSCLESKWGRGERTETNYSVGLFMAHTKAPFLYSLKCASYGFS